MICNQLLLAVEAEILQFKVVIYLIYTTCSYTLKLR